MTDVTDYHFDDFTDAEYRDLLRLAKSGWKLISFDEYRTPGRVCLWRHDVDFSIHRACSLAQIEAQEGIQATYFVLLHSNFYNLMEDEVAERVLRILELGHTLGLHFDPQFYTKTILSRAEVLKQLEFEKQILQHFIKTKINTFSVHIPEVGDRINLKDQEIAGMTNAYGQDIQNNFSYCSDSNGYWRFRRLRDVLENGSDDRLHILTHPELWTPEPMSPRSRITRCIEGRAAKQHQRYDEILKISGRKNIR